MQCVCKNIIMASEVRVLVNHELKSPRGCGIDGILEPHLDCSSFCVWCSAHEDQAIVWGSQLCVGRIRCTASQTGHASV